MSGNFNMDQVLRGFELESQRQAEKALDSRSNNQAAPYNELLVNLASLAVATAPLKTNLSGQQLLMLRDGSSVNARVDVLTAGNVIHSLYPGARIVGPFESAYVQLSPGAGTAGYARLMAIQSGFDFIEPESVPSPWPVLIATSDPLASGGTNTFCANGFRKLRLYINNAGAGTLTGYTITLAVLLPDGGTSNYYSAVNAPIIMSGGTTTRYVEAVELLPLPAIEYIDSTWSFATTGGSRLASGGTLLNYQLTVTFTGTATAVNVYVFGVE